MQRGLTLCQGQGWPNFTSFTKEFNKDFFEYKLRTDRHQIILRYRTLSGVLVPFLSDSLTVVLRVSAVGIMNVFLLSKQ
jgi:hypothetical protein